MRELKFKKGDSVRVIAELASYIDSLDDNKEYRMPMQCRAAFPGWTP